MVWFAMNCNVRRLLIALLVLAIVGYVFILNDWIAMARKRRAAPTYQPTTASGVRGLRVQTPPAILVEPELAELTGVCGLSDPSMVSCANIVMHEDRPSCTLGIRMQVDANADVGRLLPTDGSRPYPRDRDLSSSFPGLGRMSWWDIGAIGPSDAAVHLNAADGKASGRRVIVIRRARDCVIVYAVVDMLSTDLPVGLSSRLHSAQIDPPDTAMPQRAQYYEATWRRGPWAP